MLLCTVVYWALGLSLTPLLLLGLPQGLRWLCNHLEHNLLRRGCYMCAYAYAYDMRECMDDQINF